MSSAVGRRLAPPDARLFISRFMRLFLATTAPPPPTPERRSAPRPLGPRIRIMASSAAVGPHNCSVPAATNAAATNAAPIRAATDSRKSNISTHSVMDEGIRDLFCSRNRPPQGGEEGTHVATARGIGIRAADHKRASPTFPRSVHATRRVLRGRWKRAVAVTLHFARPYTGLSRRLVRRAVVRPRRDASRGLIHAIGTAAPSACTGPYSSASTEAGTSTAFNRSSSR
jgi:hypothetical protein